ncbi:MAG TPA: hypothetical protein VJM08_12715 [Anaerolineales bacterium]|nr:hypothetical protein [Anaerolineales bacterium]
MVQSNTVEADLYIKGDVGGQVVVGNYNVLIKDSNGCVVNVAHSSDRPGYSTRTFPVKLHPSAFPSLLDRVEESASVKVAIQASTQVSIFGEEGIGKTSFVRRLIHLPDLPSFSAGVVYLDVSGRGLDDVLQSLFDAFYESLPEFKPRDATIRLALQGLTALVFLDGLDIARDEIVSLLNAAPNCTFILSSVERTLWGEGQIISLRGLPENDALTLFQRELGRSLNEEEQATVRKICILLQGHPLRILQAASLVHERSKPISELLEELQRDTPEKAVLQASLNILTKDQENVLALLAAVRGNVMPLEHLVSLSQDPNVRKTLQGLIALGLVQAHSPRYSLTGNLASSLATLWDLSLWEDTLLNYFATWLEEQPAQALIEESADALIYTVKRAGEKGRWTQVIRLGRALERSLIIWKRWQAWLDILNLILKAARALGERQVEAWALHQLGSRAMCLGQTDQARELLTQALHIRKAINDKAGARVTQHNLNLLLGGSGTSNGGTSGPRPWFIGGGALLLALLMAAMATYVALSSIAPQLLATSTMIPTITKTLTSTPSRTPTSTSTSTATATNTPRPTRTSTFTPTIATIPPLACSPVLTGLKDANCRVGPSTTFEVYGTLFEGQTVDILAVNDVGSWFMVDHPQSFRNPCWVWNGPAIQVGGELSCIPRISVPPPEELQPGPYLGNPVPPVPELPPGPTIQLNPNLACYIVLSQSCPSSIWHVNPCYCDWPR